MKDKVIFLCGNAMPGDNFTTVYRWNSKTSSGERRMANIKGFACRVQQWRFDVRLGIALLCLTPSATKMVIFLFKAKHTVVKYFGTNTVSPTTILLKTVHISCASLILPEPVFLCPCLFCLIFVSLLFFFVWGGGSHFYPWYLSGILRLLLI